MYDLEKAKQAVLGFCYSHIPKTPVQIVRGLKQEVKGFYPKTPDKKVVKYLRRDVLLPLKDNGFLVRFIRGDREAWDGARTLVVNDARKGGVPVPRGVKELYQTNVFFEKDKLSKTPTIIALPNINPEHNLRAFLLLQKFKKPVNFTWKFFNLVLCASVKQSKDQLRLFIYSLHLDYDSAELLDELLEYGNDYVNFDFPLQFSMDNAKKFLNELAH